jgi:Ca2+-binding EF-hand superfamily protein
MRYRNSILPWFFGSILVLITGLAAAQDQSKSTATTETTPYQSCLKRFEAMDKKHTGRISKDEFMARKGSSPRAEKIFAAKDMNHDGNLTKEEYCKGVGVGATRSDSATPCQTRFNALDTNKDQKVSMEEYLAGRKASAKLQELFKQKDTNRDDALTLEEFCGAKGTLKPKSQ